MKGRRRDFGAADLWEATDEIVSAVRTRRRYGRPDLNRPAIAISQCLGFRFCFVSRVYRFSSFFSCLRSGRERKIEGSCTDTRYDLECMREMCYLGS